MVTKRIITSVVTSLLLFGVGSVIVFAAPAVNAASTSEACSAIGSGSAFCSSTSDQIDGSGGFARVITNLLLFIVGTAAVVMIIIGGIRYVTSNGDASNIKQAKDTIMYSVVGLIVAIMAWGIVSFVIDRVS